MRLKTAVVDDDQIVRSDTIEKLSKIKPDYLIDEFSSGFGILDTDLEYDLIILDVEMDEMDGIKTAEYIRKRKPGVHIIFVTCHLEIMSEAFKVKAFRFLTKPLISDAFQEAVEEAEKEIFSTQRIVINTQKTITSVNLDDILFFESFGDGTYIYTKDDTITSTHTLKYWIDTLSGNHFFQTHKSFIVALKYIKHINQTEIELNYLANKVPISRRKLPMLKKVFFEYVKKNAKYL